MGMARHPVHVPHRPETAAQRGDEAPTDRCRLDQDLPSSPGSKGVVAIQTRARARVRKQRDSQLDGGTADRHRGGEDRNDQHRGLRRSARRSSSGRRVRRRSLPAEPDGARRQPQ
eukprot:6584273-Pyramimonas_sp.AAC.1